VVRSMSIREARENLTRLPEQFEEDSGAGSVVQVTRHNKAVLAILPWELYESLVETLDLLDDAGFHAALRQSIAELVAGETVSWEQVQKELDL
jgi:PHD/YefM family antitoxin component YafN of YafNO toxin-antitoxin module